MRLLLLLIILIAFLQTTLISINLLILLILARSFIVETYKNYYLALFAGIMLGILSSQNIGFYPLVFLILVKLVSIIRLSAFTGNIVFILPVSFLLILFASFLEQYFLGQSLSWAKMVVETAIFLPLYILLRIWDERFTVKDSKLRI